jgi:hypothetical protein
MSELLSEQHQQNLYYDLTAPHILLRPRIFLDGDAWCALYGEDLQIGLVGFGATPSDACADFDFWYNHGKPHPGIHRRRWASPSVMEPTDRNGNTASWNEAMRIARENESRGTR